MSSRRDSLFQQDIREFPFYAGGMKLCYTWLTSNYSIATPYSPDLNSIMHARDMLRTSINTMQLNNSVMNSRRTCLDKYNNVAVSTPSRRHATSEKSCYILFLTLWHFSLDSRATVIIGFCEFCLCLHFRSKWTKRRNKEFFHRF